MAAEFSFDVVSKVDLQGVEDAVNTAMKEVATRFDFKGSNANIALDKKTAELTLAAEDDGKLKSLKDMLQNRMIKRGVPIKNMAYQTPQDAESGTRRQTVKILQGLAKDKAKEITAAIKKSGVKANAAIQEDQIRVSSRSKDDLQAAIGVLRGADFGQELQFVNYR